MIEIIRITKLDLIKELKIILKETKSFKFENWGADNYLNDLPHKWDFSIFSKLKGELAGFSINSKKLNSLYIHYFFVL